MDIIGRKLLQERKDIALGEARPKETREEADDDFDVERRDVLTALVKVNMDSDLPAEKKMSDRDVIARKSTAC